VNRLGLASLGLLALVAAAVTRAISAYGWRRFEDGRTDQCAWIDELAEECGRCLACGQETSARWDEVDRTWVPR